MEEFGEYGFFVKLDEETNIRKDVDIMTQINEDELLYNQLEMQLEMQMDMEMQIGRDDIKMNNKNIYTFIIDHIKVIWVILKLFIRNRNPPNNI